MTTPHCGSLGRSSGQQLLAGHRGSSCWPVIGAAELLGPLQNIGLHRSKARNINPSLANPADMQRATASGVHPECTANEEPASCALQHDVWPTRWRPTIKPQKRATTSTWLQTRLGGLKGCDLWCGGWARDWCGVVGGRGIGVVWWARDWCV